MTDTVDDDDDPVCYWCLGYRPCMCDDLEENTSLDTEDK